MAGGLRQNRDMRTTAQYKEQRTSVHDGTDVKNDWPHWIAMNQLLPRIAKRAENAVLVDRINFSFYQRRKVGRRCSCFNVETSPDGLCQICWGTGIVGGYDKYGTVTEVIDVTSPNLNSVNVRAAFDAATRPILFELDPAALKGYIETELDLYHNVELIDLIQTITPRLAANSSVQTFIKSPNDIDWILLSYDSLKARVGETKIYVRVEFTRTDSDIKPPQLSHVCVRYQQIESLEVIADLNRRTESITLAEFGIYDSFSSISLYFPDNIKRFSTEDFLIRLDDMTRWKIIEVNPNKPSGILLSHDITARLVQNFEGYARVP